MCLDLHQKSGWGWYRQTCISPPVTFLLTVWRRCFFCGSFLLFVFCLSLTVLSVPCSIVDSCWKRAYLLALLCVMFSCVVMNYPYGVLGQVCYLIYRFLIFAFFLPFLPKHSAFLFEFIIQTWFKITSQSCTFPWHKGFWHYSLKMHLKYVLRTPHVYYFFYREFPTDSHLTSPFPIWGLLGGIFHFYSLFKNPLFANSGEPD